jgi:hypothetical protein
MYCSQACLSKDSERHVQICDKLVAAQEVSELRRVVWSGSPGVGSCVLLDCVAGACRAAGACLLQLLMDISNNLIHVVRYRAIMLKESEVCTLVTARASESGLGQHPKVLCSGPADAS